MSFSIESVRVRSPRRVWIAATTGLLLLAAASCTTPTPGASWAEPAEAPRPVVTEAGTVEVYRAQLHGVDAAVAEVRYMHSDDPTAIVTQLHFQTVDLFALLHPTSETITVTCERFTWRPRSVVVESQGSDELRRHELHFDDRLGAVALEREDGDVRRQLTVYGVEPWEPLSLALRMRDRDTLEDFSGSFELLLGARIHRVEIEGAGRETIGDDVDTWRLTGRIFDVASREREPKTFDVWVGVTPERPVLRMTVPTEIGDLTIDRVKRIEPADRA